MKMRIVLGLCGALLSAAASAAPFLHCDPYPTNVATGAIPTEFVVTISGVAAPITTPAVPVTGGVAMKLDLGPLNLSGGKAKPVRLFNSPLGGRPLPVGLGSLPNNHHANPNWPASWRSPWKRRQEG